MTSNCTCVPTVDNCIWRTVYPLVCGAESRIRWQVQAQLPLPPEPLFLRHGPLMVIIPT